MGGLKYGLCAFQDGQAQGNPFDMDEEQTTTVVDHSEKPQEASVAKDEESLQPSKKRMASLGLHARFLNLLST